MSEKSFRHCAPPCSRFITSNDTHDLCVVCLGAEHAQSALEGADCEACGLLPQRTLRSRLALFDKHGQVRAPRGGGPASAEAERKLRSWGSQMDVTEAEETCSGFSLPSVASTSLSADPVLQCSASEDVDITSIEAGELDYVPPLAASVHADLVEVMTAAVAQLTIEWPQDKPNARPENKMDERCLKHSTKPTRRKLPFFSDQHQEVCRSWQHPYTARVFTPQTCIYSNVQGYKERGHGAMQRIEQTLASYLSPSTASSLKAPTLPSKPCRVTSTLIGKAYAAAGQSGACLHSVALLQAYQADALRELVDTGLVAADVLQPVRYAMDVSLRATREAARSLGRSMGAMVATERHLWLNLSDMKPSDK
ncbi:uncharacterized protein LOC130414411 [Triplophysa dalaica]|uniref:uncharacterized protein LOC130414411 n=1 Tax=Triplophysa dalaica TaxID=1582913 RepID=UPI0024DFAD84|nr:uncharacterized protein LOC130414411 [Triplophysa dalaica]